MSSTFSRLKGTKPVRWTTILGLLLVPLTVAGVLLWGLWNPTDRLENVTAAVVNNDEAVEVDGQLVPLGRVLAGELIDGDADSNFTWLLTDAEDAKAGLDDGRYTTVVTIPKNFSAAATSLSGEPDDAEQARIKIEESDRGRLIDTALSGIVTQTATSVLNQQLGEQFVGSVFVGMNEIGDGIGEAADGATKLADGGSQLADGAGQLADGTTLLVDGTQQLANGAGELSSGAGSLSSGAAELATGAGALSAGVTQYVDGAATLSESYQGLAAGGTAAVTQLKTIIGALTQMQADAAAHSAALTDGLAGAGTEAATFGASIEPLTLECYASGATPEFCGKMAGAMGASVKAIGDELANAGTGAADLGTAMSGVQETLGGQATPGVDPVAQLDQLTTGLSEFGTGLSDFATQGAELSTGAAALATGSTGLSDGAAQLATGTSQLATGTSELAAGVPDLADGATKLAEGAGQSATGAKTLAEGLGEAASGIPSYTESQRDKLAQTAVTPVKAEGASDELFNASGVPLFAGIALWAGALAAFLLLAPLWSRTRDAARGVGWITLRSALPAIVLGAVQGGIAGIVLPIALGYDLAQGAAFFGLALLTGVAFTLLLQGLTALLGGLGRFIAFALLVVAFAVGIVSTVPGPLAAIGDASPIGAAMGGFQAIAMSATGAGAAVTALVLWAAGGLVLTAFAVARARK
ncbi:putative membrane protein [Leucobacter exalbidus]|uniref:Membrane protein n=1 Tax=Leucobacter exalbidus TaxID=662960 RepID=A0A940PUG8_9MICO|nr:YhgE/Pip family protein [Leucobacter exalbidus]MBP1326435.1 putative membrane protein [Leucobacter exalbidus]